MSKTLFSFSLAQLMPFAIGHQDGYRLGITHSFDNLETLISIQISTTIFLQLISKFHHIHCTCAICEKEEEMNDNVSN
jgi:hypothetical protein